MAEPTPCMVETEIVGPSAWTTATISSKDWQVPVSAACAQELSAVIGPAARKSAADHPA